MAGGGLVLAGSVIRIGSISCGGFGVKDTTIDDVDHDNGGWPMAPGSSITARSRTVPLHAASGTSKFSESPSRSRSGIGDA